MSTLALEWLTRRQGPGHNFEVRVVVELQAEKCARNPNMPRSHSYMSRRSHSGICFDGRRKKHMSLENPERKHVRDAPASVGCRMDMRTSGSA